MPAVEQLTSFGESTVTVHGNSDIESEDPLSPTASSETIPIPPPSATLGEVLETATGVELDAAVVWGAGNRSN